MAVMSIMNSRPLNFIDRHLSGPFSDLYISVALFCTSFLQLFILQDRDSRKVVIQLPFGGGIAIFGVWKYSMYRDRSGGGFNRPPREMHDATCSECNQKTQVPFKPSQDRPVYCRDCFQKRRPNRF
ncbi:MAG: CxxC-x17-CxxC domain-containing protein [Thermoplasmatota archaeon]